MVKPCDFILVLLIIAKPYDQTECDESFSFVCDERAFSADSATDAFLYMLGRIRLQWRCVLVILECAAYQAWRVLLILHSLENNSLEVGGFKRMRPQPGNALQEA